MSSLVKVIYHGTVCFSLTKYGEEMQVIGTITKIKNDLVNLPWPLIMPLFTLFWNIGRKQADYKGKTGKEHWEEVFILLTYDFLTFKTSKVIIFKCLGEKQHNKTT